MQPTEISLRTDGGGSRSPRSVRERSREESEPMIRQLLDRVGVDRTKLNPTIFDRLVLLDQRSPFMEDEARCMALAEQVFAFAEEEEMAWRDQEKHLVLKGTLLSDIGKTGPKDARPDQAELVVKIFTIENVTDPARRTMEALFREEYVREYPMDDVEERMQAFQDLGLSLTMTIRQFYNKHAEWTAEIINHDGIGSEVIAIASLHHVLEGVNPEGFLREDGSLSHAGGNARFDRPEKLVILLDKYDAARQRSEKTHAEAIQYLRDYIGKSERFGDDEEFQKLITLLDHSLKSLVP